MNYEGLELWRLALALRRPVGTSAGTHRARPVVLVRVITDGADGWGECGALADGTSVDPPLDAVWRALVDRGVDRLATAARARDGELPPAAVVAHLFDTTPTSRMAAAALEMAVLDAELRAAGQSLIDRLGVPPDVRAAGVAAGAVVGIPPDREPGALVDDVGRLVDAGFARVRLKIEPGWDVAPVAAVRRAFPTLAVQVDANGAYRLSTGATDTPVDGTPANDARRLAALDELDVACIEQPLPPADLPGHAELAERLATPVALDESLTSVRAVEDAIRYGACEVACLKPARLGGLLAARRAVETCQAAGVAAFVGGFFETGLGRTANAVLAAVPGFTVPGDLSDPAGYLVANPVPYVPVAGGRVTLPTAPGVGARPHPSALSGQADQVRRFDVDG
ncbi:MAG TPA: enolase C-terminal domain-like protein [Acidimicrobiales bacterium]|nr:enolase C-terminal domain-like protein [Acidimicrobiales bacterium]